ncbi:uncharacterized protein LOC107050930 [Gallus gallus]|uniref:uncharacterized protein LOC107050930 n=1 Tax=Gallus gallus TaxID=9031 RepID=UPI001AE549AF|nr:uncharacterized protein LOC107050930 [Gallus gallus]
MATFTLFGVTPADTSIYWCFYHIADTYLLPSALGGRVMLKVTWGPAPPVAEESHGNLVVVMIASDVEACMEITIVVRQLTKEMKWKFGEEQAITVADLEEEDVVSERGRPAKQQQRLWRTMAASAVLSVMALSHCSIVFVAEYHRVFGDNGSEADGEGGYGVNLTKTRESGIRRISSPNTNCNISSLKFSACTTPNTPHIPTTTLWTSQNAPETQPSLGYHCYDDFSQAQLHFVLPLRLSLFLILFLIPFAITMFCYIGLIRALLTRPHIPLQKKYRTVGLALVTMVNFGVCFGPYNLSHVVGFVQQRSPEWRPYALLLTTLSAALDPFIFYFSSSAVRRAVSGMVGAIRGTICGFWGWCWQRQ